MNKIELLAPAGNIETFEKVIDDADAVYCGLRNFNARMRGRNFSYDELAAAVKFAHSKQKKVYAAFNTLIKEKELPKAVEQLQFLNDIKIDAVIIQDLGLLHIINNFFPKLNIHASTQMFFADQYALNFAKNNNISRVILPRELTFEELKKLNDITKVELEVFCHGAMCYSISGYCMMSHHIGGQSANRGFCGQPCRRKYFKKNKNGDGSYFFSLADLCLIDYLPELLKLDKIKSLKIEGRLKSPDMLNKITAAYRKVINAITSEDSDLINIINDEKKILIELNGRPLSNGYLNFDENKEIMFSGGQTDLYTVAGKILNIKSNKIHFKTFCAIDKNSKFKIARAKKRISFSIQKITDLQNNEINSAAADTEIFIYPSIQITANDSIFILKTNEFVFNDKLMITPPKIKIQKYNFTADKNNIDKILNFLKSQPQNKNTRVVKKYYYINEKELGTVSSSFIKKNNIILEICAIEISEARAAWKNLSNKNCIISLPLVFDNSQLSTRIKNLKERGFINFMLAHISQYELIRNIFQKRPVIFANNTIYITNTAAANFLEFNKFTGFVFAYENELQNIEFIKTNLQKFIFIQSKPKLFISRAINKNIIPNIQYSDEYNKLFNLKIENNLLCVYPTTPQSLELHQKFFDDNSISIVQ